MRILIVEDEPPIAEYLEDSLWTILGNKVKDIHIAYSIEEAFKCIFNRTFDLCFLDLNLSGDDGYDILKKTASKPFQTIIVSAYTERAIHAFEYGVTDFIPKPFSMKRLRQALDRYFGHLTIPTQMKYLVVCKSGNHVLLPVADVEYFKADRYLIEVHLVNDIVEYVEKPLNQLERILPENFLRIHRSYIVNLRFVKSYHHLDSGAYRVRLSDKTVLPVSRNRAEIFKDAVQRRTFR